MNNYLINDFVVESSTLHASEYVSKKEMEDFAKKNNFLKAQKRRLEEFNDNRFSLKLTQNKS